MKLAASTINNKEDLSMKSTTNKEDTIMMKEEKTGNNNEVISMGKIPTDITDKGNTPKKAISFKLSVDEITQLDELVKQGGYDDRSSYIRSVVFNRRDTNITVDGGKELFAVLSNCANELQDISSMLDRDVSETGVQVLLHDVQQAQSQLNERFAEIELNVAHMFKCVDTIKASVISQNEEEVTR